MDRQHCRILILDLDESVLVTLERMLEDAGFDTTTTWDADEALELLGSNYFDLVLLGDHPPELDAEMILSRFHTHSPRPACIVLRSATCRWVERFYALGAFAVVPRWDYLNVLDAIRKRYCSYAFGGGPQSQAMAS